MKKYRKILLIRLSALGDILLCTPYIRCLKEQYGGQIYILTKAGGMAVLENNPYIEKILLWDAPLNEMVEKIKAEKFDCIIDEHNNFTTMRLRCLLRGIPCYTYHKNRIKRFLGIQFSKKQWFPSMHVIDRYFTSTRNWPVKNDGKGMDFFAFAPVEGLPEEVRTWVQNSTPFICIGIGSRHYTKQITLEKLRFICDRLEFPCVLLGDENDVEKANYILQTHRGKQPLVNMCNRLAIGQTATLVKASSLLISGDSFLMHLGCALNHPMISVWGSTHPILGFYPIYPKDSKVPHFIFENKDLKCRPCHKHGRENCPKKHFDCIEKIDYSELVRTANQIVLQQQTDHYRNLIQNQAPAQTAEEGITRLQRILSLLRIHCPWDRKQTFDSLRYLTIEETFELSDAILDQNVEDIKKELGDVLLHLCFYAQLGEEKKWFDFVDVCNSICDKLIRRHPHIFSDTVAATDEDVKQNWEKIKLQEGRKHSVLSGVPRSLPAMVKAMRIQEKVKGVGFDWENDLQVWDKVEEELKEFQTEVKSLKEHGTSEFQQNRVLDELGDVFFALINYARFLNINPDDALEHCNKKFIRRFQYLESQTIAQGKDLQSMSLDEMNRYWEEAKSQEKEL